MQLQIKAIVNCSLHQQLNTILCLVIKPFLCCFLTQKLLRIAPGIVTKGALDQDVGNAHEPYNVRVCNVAVDFAEWSTNSVGPREHQYLGYTAFPVMFRSLTLADRPGWTFNQLH